jgi:hypothetical protein
MPRFRIPYNAEAFFAGPSPASGYHFISLDAGVLNNDFTDVTDNINLISVLNRIQSVSFDISTPKTDVKGFGNYGSIRRYQSEPPIATVTFDYLQMGVRNEDKLGLYVNFPKVNSSGQLSSEVFTENYNVFLLSGFYTSSLNKNTNRSLGWPLDYRDNKNLFLAINKGDNLDFNARTTGAPLQNCDVFAFGNCYLDSYQARGSVGDFPRVTCQYTAENVVFYTSGSGIANPALNPQTYTKDETVKCVIPNGYSSGYVSVLEPGDISINITSFPLTTGVSALKGTGIARAANPSIYNLGIAYTGIQIQNYDLSFQLNRRPINSLTHILPLNRKVVFPVKCNVGMQIIVHDYVSGSIENIFRNEENYDLSIIIRNPSRAAIQGIAVRYDLKKAVLDSMSYDTSIGANKVLNLSFSTELSPTDYSKGLFISGLYNTNEFQNNTSVLLQEDGFRILQEDGSLILLEQNTFQV